MAMTQNPFDSSVCPSDGDAARSGAVKNAGIGASVTIGAVLGGMIGMVSYVAGGLFIELVVVPQLVVPDAPRLPNGQLAGMIMSPLAGLFGIALGAGIVLCLMGRRFAGGVLVVFSALVVTSIVASMWRSQVTTYGRDVSEAVLFAPFLPHAIVAILLGTFCMILPRKTRFCAARHFSRGHSALPPTYRRG